MCKGGDIMVPLLVLAGLVIGGIAIAANWKAIVDWLKDFIPKLRETWKKSEGKRSLWGKNCW